MKWKRPCQTKTDEFYHSTGMQPDHNEINVENMHRVHILTGFGELQSKCRVRTEDDRFQVTQSLFEGFQQHIFLMTHCKCLLTNQRYRYWGMKMGGE